MHKSRDLLKEFERIGICQKVHSISAGGRILDVYRFGESTVFYMMNTSSKSTTVSYIKNFDRLDEMLEQTSLACKRVALAAQLQGRDSEQYQTTVDIDNYRADITVQIDSRKPDVLPMGKKGTTIRWLEHVDNMLCSVRVVLTVV